MRVFRNGCNGRVVWESIKLPANRYRVVSTDKPASGNPGSSTTVEFTNREIMKAPNTAGWLKEWTRESDAVLLHGSGLRFLVKRDQEGIDIEPDEASLAIWQAGRLSAGDELGEIFERIQQLLGQAAVIVGNADREVNEDE